MLSTNSFAQGGQKWSLNGNSASASNFLGTTNAAPLIFKTNSTERLTFDENGTIVFNGFANGQTGIAFLKDDGVLQKLPLTNSGNDVLCGDGQFRDIYSLSPQTGWKLNGMTIYTDPGYQIGLGTHTPGALLDVNGDAIIRGTLQVYNGIIVGRRYEGEKAVVDTVKATNMETDEMKAEQYKTNTINIDGNNSKITSSTGLIDFDNTTIRANNMLTNNFHIYGTATMDSLEVGEQLKIGNNSMYLSSNSPSPGTIVNSIYTDDGDLYIQSQNYNNNTIINANNTGFLGIGTDNPQQNVHIKGVTQGNSGTTATLSAVIRIEDKYVSNTIPSGDRTSCWDIAASAGSHGLFFTTDDGWGADHIVLTLRESTGFVGIGLSNPTEKLHVRGDQSPVFMKVENDFGFTSIGFNGAHGIIESNARLQLNYYSGQDVVVGGPNGGPLYAMHDTYLAVTDGNVGIGTTNPGNYKLAVEGSICARRVKVTEAPFWADFVFEPDYELMSLEEVEEFIEENGHLPGVPSAEEVEKDGVDLLEMNAILLQKIEELTLYIIELEKKINEK